MYQDLSTILQQMARKTSKSSSRRRKTSMDAARGPKGFPPNIERSLSQILESLAHILVQSGISFPSLTRMARVAFVSAARDSKQDAGRAPKISIASIAASTGLTRPEVSRILRSGCVSTTAHSMSRAEQVAGGWITDKQYIGTRKSPRPLRFEGKGATFSSLVRAYSGDIPARAMLLEMKRLQMVHQDETDTIRLVRKAGKIPPTTASALRAIYPWVSVLSESVKHVSRHSLTSKTDHLSLNFDSVPQALGAVRILSERREAFLESIAQLGTYAPRGSTCKVDVTVAVAAATPYLVSLSARTQRRAKK